MPAVERGARVAILQRSRRATIFSYIPILGHRIVKLRVVLMRVQILRLEHSVEHGVFVLIFEIGFTDNDSL